MEKTIRVNIEKEELWPVFLTNTWGFDGDDQIEIPIKLHIRSMQAMDELRKISSLLEEYYDAWKAGDENESRA